MKKTIAQLKAKIAASGVESLTADELADLKKVQALTATTAPAKPATVREEFCFKCGIMLIAATDTFKRNDRGQIICEWCEREDGQ